MDQNDIADLPAEPAQRPWIVLADTYDVEAWIANYNRSLQAAIKVPREQTVLCSRIRNTNALC